jgi:hypothetical protein
MRDPQAEHRKESPRRPARRGDDTGHTTRLADSGEVNPIEFAHGLDQFLASPDKSTVVMLTIIHQMILPVKTQGRSPVSAKGAGDAVVRVWGSLAGTKRPRLMLRASNGPNGLLAGGSR